MRRHPGSIYENNLPGGGKHPPFKEIYNTDITGGVDLGTGEWANVILRFNLTQSNGKYFLLNQNADLISENALKQHVTGSSPMNKTLVYDFMGSGETSNVSDGEGPDMRGPGWWESEALNQGLDFPNLLPGHFQRTHGGHAVRIKFKSSTTANYDNDYIAVAISNGDEWQFWFDDDGSSSTGEYYGTPGRIRVQIQGKASAVLIAAEFAKAVHADVAFAGEVFCEVEGVYVTLSQVADSPVTVSTSLSTSEIEIEHSVSKPKAGIALMSDEVMRHPSLDKIRSSWLYMRERSYKFDFPFVVKKVSMDVEVLAANSAAFGTPTQNSTINMGPTPINWTFKPINPAHSYWMDKASDSRNIAATHGGGGHLRYQGVGATNYINQTVEVPHATFLIVKSFGNADQLRGRHGSGSILEAHTKRFPVGKAILNDSLVVTQPIFSATFGLTGAAVGNSERGYYPNFDYMFPESALSASTTASAFFVTRSVSISKKPIMRKFSVTRSMHDEFHVRRNLTPMSQQTNFINK